MTEGTLIVDRDDVRVMFRRTSDEKEAITRTWAEVESAIGQLRGRKFYGVVDSETNEYRVCVQWRDGVRATKPAATSTTTNGLSSSQR